MSRTKQREARLALGMHSSAAPGAQGTQGWGLGEGGDPGVTETRLLFSPKDLLWHSTVKDGIKHPKLSSTPSPWSLEVG